MSNNTSLSIPLHSNDVAFVVMVTSWVILGILSVMFNLLVCYSVYTMKKLRTITNCFVVSLSVADMLVGLVCTPMYIIDHYAETIITGYLIAFILFASIFNLAAVTFERFIALTRPFQYRSVMSTRHVGIIISIAWLSPLILSILPLTWSTVNAKKPIDNVYKLLLVILILLPIVIMIGIYSKLLGVVRSFILRNKSRASAGNRTGYRVGREEKAAQVFASVFVTFLVCWGPIIYINICEVAYAKRKTFLPIELLYISFYTLQINSILDPIIYAFFKRDFIKARQQWNYCCCGYERHDDISSEVMLQNISSNRNSLISRNTCKQL